MDPFYVSLPKIELHAHLNGSLSVKTLKELNASDESIENFLKLNGVHNFGHERTLSECFELFKIAHNCTSNPVAVRKCTVDVIREFAEDGVVYLELRTTPRETEHMTKVEYVEAVISGVRDVRAAGVDIEVRLILSIDRRHSDDVSGATVDLATELQRQYPDIIAGIDVCGDPTKGTWFESHLRKAKSNGLKVTVHCAEVVNRSEVEAILKFHPDRIGHGTCIHPDFGGDDNLWKLLLESKIPVECCLTSNLKTETIRAYKQHHARHLMEENHPFSLATDDKGVFDTNLSDEYNIAAKEFGWDKQQLFAINYNTIEHIFADDSVKNKLKKRLDDWKENHL